MIEALHDPELLGDTPIGTLAVVEWCGGAAVAVMYEEEPTRIKRIIHQLEVGENPLNAIYGKKTLEQRAVREAYNQHAEVKKETERRFERDHSRDFSGAVQRVLGKSWSGEAREILSTMIRWRS